MLAFAKYFVEKAKANQMGTFYWMGLSDGSHRSVPEFNQADLKDAIIKGYYGEAGYTGINAPQADSNQLVSSIYDLLGCKRPTLLHGLNIVQLSDGTVRKLAR